MQIGLVCPVWFPVPPEAYGGTERVVALLADGLVDAGHDVTLFASGDSQTRARLESVFHTAPSEWIGHTYWEMQHSVHAFLKADEFDVLHDHTGMLGLAFGGLIDTPFCHTVHGPLDGQPGRMYEQVLGLAPKAKLISISMNQRKPKQDLPWIGNCPNALDLSMYPFRRKPGGDYLVFLGRMSPDKGAHRALAVALETGHPAQDRREVPRAARDPLLRRVHSPAPRRLDRVRRRGRARGQGRAPHGRPRAHLAHRLGGAVRPDDDRGHGVRDAGHLDAARRRPRDRRARPHRSHRRQLPRHGGSRRPRAR